MKKIIKLMIIPLMVVMILCVYNVKVNAETEDNIVKYAKSAVLIEVETGKVLYEKNSHIRYEPASMTKMMTMKLVLDAIKSKRINMKDELITSEYASKMGGSQIFLSVGEVMKVEDLFKSMIIASANDAAVSLAEGISGSDKFFVEQMNTEVKKLGLKNTHFTNVTGLPTENHYSSSFDMAMIARNLLLEYEEEVIPYTSRYEDYVRKDSDNPFWLVNTNKLIKHVDGIDGLKTGWTEAAGYCLTCTKQENGMRLISVVMNVDSVIHRTEDTLSLLNYGFATYEKKILLDKGTLIETDYNILLDPSKYNIITSENICLINKKGNKIGEYEEKIIINEKSISNSNKYDVGRIEIYINGVLVDEAKLELVEITHKSSFFEVLFELFKMIF